MPVICVVVFLSSGVDYEDPCPGYGMPSHLCDTLLAHRSSPLIDQYVNLSGSGGSRQDWGRRSR